MRLCAWTGRAVRGMTVTRNTQIIQHFTVTRSAYDHLKQITRNLCDTAILFAISHRKEALWQIRIPLLGKVLTPELDCISVLGLRFALDGALIVRVLDLLVAPALRLVLELPEAALVGGGQRLVRQQLLRHCPLAILLHEPPCAQWKNIKKPITSSFFHA